RTSRNLAVLTSPDPLLRLLRPFGRHPARSAVLLDFDGALAPIVADPDAARPLPGALAALQRLVGRIGEVAVVSGRPVAFLQNALPGTLVGGQGRPESGRDASAAAGEAAGGRGAASPIGNGAVPGVVLVGQHGLERVVAGRREVDPRVAPWRAAVAAATR